MTMDSEHPEEHRHLEDGTAAIAPVTDAMMDHAAREAAALADGVAHGTVTLETAATHEADAAADAATAPVEAAADLSGAASGTVAAAAQAVTHAVEQAADGTGRAAGRASEAVRDSASHTVDALGDYGAKVIDIVHTNLAAASAHLAALLQAKSIPEAVSLNAEHLRRQIETLTGQGRELATLAQRAALDALRPFRDAAKDGR